jgi:hypothetical protein
MTQVQRRMESVASRIPDRTRAVTSVGTGRGFIIEADDHPLKRRYVITAAHCLPKSPPRHPAAYPKERTFRLLAPLGAKRQKIWRNVCSWLPSHCNQSIPTRPIKKSSGLPSPLSEG